MNKREWTIYFAGLFDGEGSVGIYGQNTQQSDNSFFLNVTLAQKRGPSSRIVMNKLVELFGGKCYEYSNMRKWHITRRHCVPFLKAILPFITIKRRQVDKCIQWEESKLGLKPGPIPKNMLPLYSRWIKSTIKIASEVKHLKKSGL